MNDFVEIGSIAGFFGIKGWVKIYSHTRPRNNIANYNNLYVGFNKKAIRFSKIKSQGKHIVGHIEGVDTREMASMYLGESLFMKATDLPKLDNEYYWHELIGLVVINQHEQKLGTIIEMMETGANDVMVIRNEHEEETLIPFVFSHFITSVDSNKREMRVNWESDSENIVDDNAN